MTANLTYNNVYYLMNLVVIVVALLHFHVMKSLKWILLTLIQNAHCGWMITCMVNCHVCVTHRMWHLCILLVSDAFTLITTNLWHIISRNSHHFIERGKSCSADLTSHFFLAVVSTRLITKAPHVVVFQMIKPNLHLCCSADYWGFLSPQLNICPHWEASVNRSCVRLWSTLRCCTYYQLTVMQV
jgi:hypothetical protein